LAAFTTRALVFGNPEKAVYFRILKDFLFKLGMRDTTFISDPAEISKQIFDNVWPIVVIDHSDGSTDGFAVFDGIYKTLGHELLSFVFLAPGDKVVFQLFSESAGARGVVQKPLQPLDAAKLFRMLMPPPGDNATTLALQISRLMLRGELTKAAPALTKLTTVPYFRRQAETALIRIEIRLAHMAQAQQRLARLLMKDERDVRVLCEYAEFHKKNSQYAQAISLYRRIRSLHTQLNIKIWDQIHLHVELDQLDEAGLLLDGLQGDPTFRDLSTEGLAKLMHIMGLAHSVSNVLKSQPDLIKQYATYLNVHAQARG